MSQTRSLGANDRRPTTYCTHSTVRLSFIHPLAEERMTHIPDKRLSSFILFTSLFPPLKILNGFSFCPFPLAARQTVTLSFPCPVDHMVTLDVPSLIHSSRVWHMKPDWCFIHSNYVFLCILLFMKFAPHVKNKTDDTINKVSGVMLCQGGTFAQS